MIDTDERIRVSPLREELESRYLAYALSTIIARSLPDVRDGMKPVQRRILFAMRALHLDPGSGFKKSARVVGDVIGKFHPHGDQAAYEAMVRLAQEFALRYPLVEGQGNFGNIDGDGPAAMRYTEARLTRVAQALMEGLDQQTVDFVPTYDGSLEEPTVFPARFPNLLANGASGIAVGMSTSIPPHNVGEILDASLHLITHPDATVAELMTYLPGPDFPTGGILAADPEERLQVYQTGRGTLRLRCRWRRELLDHGMWRLVITEIPYQVTKARLIERIAVLIVEQKCPFLTDVRDESDTHLRIVLEPRSRNLDPELIMAYLFKNSDLEVRVSFNLNVVTAEVRPEVLDLRGLLQAWLQHRFQVLERSFRFRLGELRKRLHHLAAQLIVHLNLDEVIAIIRTHDDPAPVLMARFGLDQEQAEAILNLRLRSLRRLEEMTIKREIEEKQRLADELAHTLAEPSRLWEAVRQDLNRTRQEFADSRRTELTDAPREVDLQPAVQVAREPLTLVLSRLGWIKSLKGHDAEPIARLRFKGQDTLALTVATYSNEQVSFVAASGKVFSLLADRIPSGKGFGEPLTMIFDLNSGDRVVLALAIQPRQDYFVTTRQGLGFRILGEELTTSHRSGKQVITLSPEDTLRHILPVKGEMVAAISHQRRLLVCRLDEFPLLAKGKGVRIMRLLKGDFLVDAITFSAATGVTLDSGKRTRLLSEVTNWLGARASRGAMLPHGFLSGAVFAGTGTAVVEAARGVTGELFQTDE